MKKYYIYEQDEKVYETCLVQKAIEEYERLVCSWMERAPQWWSSDDDLDDDTILNAVYNQYSLHIQSKFDSGRIDVHGFFPENSPGRFQTIKLVINNKVDSYKNPRPLFELTAVSEIQGKRSRWKWIEAVL